MKNVTIQLRSVQDVQEFVSLSTTLAYPVTVADHRHKVNGKSFMEMFCLDLSQPIQVCLECSLEELSHFRAIAGKFLLP